MNNFKTNSLLVVGVVALMVGCGTGNIRPLNISEVDKSGRNNPNIFISVASIGGIFTADQVCNEAPAAGNDDRCRNRGAYYGVGGTPYLAVAGRQIPVLVPMQEQVGANDIIKIRLKDGVPAYFVQVVTKGGLGFAADKPQFDRNSDCYNENRLSVAVVCPKYNWSYKDLEPRN